jgi:hypothetical protein
MDHNRLNSFLNTVGINKKSDQLSISQFLNSFAISLVAEQSTKQKAPLSTHFFIIYMHQDSNPIFNKRLIIFYNTNFKLSNISISEKKYNSP